jgi:hypothetical protein
VDIAKHAAKVTFLVALGISACSTTTGGLYGPPASAAFGTSGCLPDASGDLCRQFAGNTIQSWGPWRYDYLAPNGDAVRWIGNSLVRGKWYTNGGGAEICVAIPEASSPRCGGRSRLVGEIDSILVGDPFGLAARTSAPLPLKYRGGGNVPELLRQAGVDPAGVTIIKGLPR